MRVRDGHDAALSAYLTNLGANIGTPTDIPFDALRTVHFFRWVVVRDTAQKPWLAFETNYDGPLEEHLGEIVREAPRAVQTIHGHCEGYPLAEAATLGPDAASRVVSYWRGQAVESRAFYRAMTGKTAERIRRESEIRDSIEGFVDDCRKASPGELTDPAVMYDAIVRHLESKGLLEDARAKQPPLPVSSLWPVVLRVLPFVPLALPLAPLAALVALSAYGVLRLKENADRQDDVTTEPPRIRELAEREDFQVQNQLTHLVDVKKGLLRAALLRGVLGLIDVLAKYQFNQGQLGGITDDSFCPMGLHRRWQAPLVLQQLRRKLGELLGRVHRSGFCGSDRRVEQHGRFPTNEEPRGEGGDGRRALQVLDA